MKIFDGISPKFFAFFDILIVLSFLWLVFSNFYSEFYNPLITFVVVNILIALRFFFGRLQDVTVAFPAFARRSQGFEDSAGDRFLFLSIFLTSATILMMEILLTRIFSVTLFYHFAFMAVSVAIFGSSVSGVFVYLFPRFFSESRARFHLSLSMLLSAVTAVLAVIILLHLKIGDRFTPLNLKRLVIAYVLSAVPFFFGGLAITLSLTHYAKRVSKIYFWDLVGAGTGCFLVIPLLNIVDAPSAVFLVAAVASLAAYFFNSVLKNKGFQKALILSAFIFYLLVPINNHFRFLKVEYPKGREVDFNKVVVEKWNSFSRIAVYDQYHMDWSLSREYKGTPAQSKYMDIDALASTPIINFDGDLRNIQYIKWELTYAGFIFREAPKVFLIGPGGGRDIAAALVAGSKHVDAAEINPIIVNDIMLKRFNEYSGDIYRYDGVNVYISDARSFIRSSDDEYDLILASLVDTWAASSAGAYNLSENNLYTVEAFLDFYNHLSEEGVLSIERWDSEALRLLSVANEMGGKVGIKDISKHVAVVGYKRLDNFLFKKTPWKPDDIALLNKWCFERGFWVLYAPFNAEADNEFFNFFKSQNSDNIAFSRKYPYDLTPVTDDRPFFFQKEKPKSFKDLVKREIEKGSFFKGKMLFNRGVSSLQFFIIVLSFLVLMVIFVPLLGLKRKEIKRGFLGKIPAVFYFASLGLGFILIEVVMIQKFILFLGHPIYSFSVVLFSLLIFGGFGSRYTSKWSEEEPRGRIFKVLFFLVAISTVYLLVLSPMFYSLFKLPSFGRIILSVLFLAPLAFFMGMPLPLGIRYVNNSHKEIIPWVWAINGSFSVLGSCLAVYFAITRGFNYALKAGILCYAAAFVFSLFFRKMTGDSRA